MPGSKTGPSGFERCAKFDREEKKAYFTSTLSGRKASAFPLRQPDTWAGWFSPTEMSARAGSDAWRSGCGAQTFL